MTPKARRPARREPRQERSRAMVERIIQAGQAVLLERGYDGTTTNHIAARAGISPGSLYQYFPDKDAILARVITRYTEQLQARISHAFLGTLAETSVVDSVRANLNAILDAFEENTALLRVVYEELPRSRDSQVATFARQVDQLVAAALLYGGRSAQPVEAVAWVLVRTVQHVTSSYVLERPPIPRSAVVDELTTLLAGYLTNRLVRPPG